MGSGKALPALALVANAFVWGVSWWPFRELQDRGMHPLWSTALVYAVSLAVIVLLAPSAWRAVARHPQLWLLGLAAGCTNVCFNWGVTVGDVVRVVLLFYLMPAWTVVVAWWLLGEKPSMLALVRLALAMAGVLIVLGTDGAWPVPRSLPDWLALLGGLSFSITNAMLRRLGDVVDADSRMLAMFTGGTLLASLAAVIGHTVGVVSSAPMLDLPGVGFAALLCVGFLLGNLALQYGAARLAAHTTALIMLSEVVFASFSSVALGASELVPRTLLGAALILVSAAWAAWPSRSAAQSAA